MAATVHHIAPLVLPQRDIGIGGVAAAAHETLASVELLAQPPSAGDIVTYWTWWFVFIGAALSMVRAALTLYAHYRRDTHVSHVPRVTLNNGTPRNDDNDDDDATEGWSSPSYAWQQLTTAAAGVVLGTAPMRVEKRKKLY